MTEATRWKKLTTDIAHCDTAKIPREHYPVRCELGWYLGPINCALPFVNKLAGANFNKRKLSDSMKVRC
jgi:hypothetical protein